LGSPGFFITLIGALVAPFGLGAAYTGHCRRPIGWPAFIALNVLSLSLVFGEPTVTIVAGSGVIAILAWHMRPESP
jgi:hypothetical protein